MNKIYFFKNKKQKSSPTKLWKMEEDDATRNNNNVGENIQDEVIVATKAQNSVSSSDEGPQITSQQQQQSGDGAIIIGEETKQDKGEESSSSERKPMQLKLQFMAVGGAPILKKNKFQVRDSMTVAEVLLFLRRTLKVREGDPLFLYVNSSFAPGLDQGLKCLHESFQVNGELVFQYAITSSWGWKKQNHIFIIDEWMWMMIYCIYPVL